MVVVTGLGATSPHAVTAAAPANNAAARVSDLPPGTENRRSGTLTGTAPPQNGHDVEPTFT
jgi:hypothetical protein